MNTHYTYYTNSHISHYISLIKHCVQSRINNKYTYKTDYRLINENNILKHWIINTHIYIQSIYIMSDRLTNYLCNIKKFLSIL